MAITVKNVSGSNETTGRNHDIWGTREVGLYRVTLDSSAPVGGYAFDPKQFGFQNVVAAVYCSPHILVANAAKMRYLFFYDFVNKKIVPADITDSFDDANGDDLSTVILDIIVVGE